MSSISVNTITDASGGSTTSINGFTPSVSNMAGRNRIINGNFLVAQRGTSFTGVVMSGADSPYNLDRWHTGRANVGDTGQCTISQVTGGGIRYETTTADASLTAGSATSLRQIIEGYNCIDLAGKPFTVSFKMKTNKLGTYGVWIYDYTGAGYKTSSITVTSAGTVESYSITFDSVAAITIDNAARLGLNITLVAASSREGFWYPTGETQVNLFDTVGNYVEIYDVQLEAGSVATPFEHRQYGQELALCQRYFFRWANDRGSEVYDIGLQAYSASAAFGKLFDFPVVMRAIPTVTISGTFIPFSATGSSTTAFTNKANFNPTTHSLSTGSWSGSSGLVAGNVTMLYVGISAVIDLSAEL